MIAEPTALHLMHTVLVRQERGLSGLMLNYTIVARKRSDSNSVGGRGPSTVVPAAWFSHQPLATPPPPSPPPPPPPPSPLCAPSSKSVKHLPIHGQWWHMIHWVETRAESYAVCKPVLTMAQVHASSGGNVQSEHSQSTSLHRRPGVLERCHGNRRALLRTQGMRVPSRPGKRWLLCASAR